MKSRFHAYVTRFKKITNRKKRITQWSTSALVFFLLFFPALKTIAIIPDGHVTDKIINAWLEVKDKGPFYVGDSIPVNLIVEGDLGTEYYLPEFDTRQLGGLELAAKDKVTKEKVKGGWKDTVSYRFVGWRAGEYRITGLTVNYRDRAGKDGSFKVKELNLKIASLLPANLTEDEVLADGLKSLKKPVNLPPRYQYIWYLLAGIGIFGLAYWLLKYWKVSRRNKALPQNGTESVKTEPAHLIALRRLDELHRKQLLTEGEYKLFYDQLSEIAREYLENRFQIRALEMTTEEFLISLGKLDFLSQSQKRSVSEFLQYSDLVKFAKHQPMKEEGEKAFSIIQGLVEETKEQVEPSEAAAAQG